MWRFQVSVQKGHAPRLTPRIWDSWTLGGGDLKWQCKKVTPHAPRPCSYIVRFHMWRFQVSVQKGHAPRPTPKIWDSLT